MKITKRGKMRRGFEVVTTFLNEHINLPIRKTTFSAGYDFEAAKQVILQPNETKLIPTGVKAYMQADEVLKLYIRSSLAYKKQLNLANGVGIIDADYYNNSDNEGHIMILITNNGNSKVIIEKGERVAQGIFEKYLLIDNEEKLEINREGGFGSTGE